MTIKVLRGDPTPEELAAALVVLQARAAAGPAGADEPGALDVWADKRRNVLRTGMMPPGPDTWRTSYWPN